MALLERPSAIRPEDLALARGERLERIVVALAAEHAGDDLGVERRAAGRNAADGVGEGVDVRDAVLEQVADAGGVVGEQLAGVGLLDVLGEDEHADVGQLGAGSPARRECPRRCGSGGMRTSTIAASGLCARTLRSRSSASPAWPTTSKPGLLEQADEPLAQAAPSRRRRPASSGQPNRAGCWLARSVPPESPSPTLKLPSRAATRSARPLQAGAVRIGAAAAVVEHLDGERAVALDHADRGASRPRRAWRRWRGPRRRGSRWRPRRRRRGVRSTSAVSATGTGAREARASSAGTSPRSVSRPGWMPRASSRSSAVACSSSAVASSSSFAGLGGVLLQPRAGQLQVQGECQQPLLGAVVEVALDSSALPVAGLDDARARGAQLLEPGAELGVEALVLHPQPRRGGDRGDQLLGVVEPPVVDDRADALAVVGHLGCHRRESPGPGRLDPGAVGVDVAVGLGHPVGELDDSGPRAPRPGRRAGRRPRPARGQARPPGRRRPRRARCGCAAGRRGRRTGSPRRGPARRRRPPGAALRERQRPRPRASARAATG